MILELTRSLDGPVDGNQSRKSVWTNLNKSPEREYDIVTQMILMPITLSRLSDSKFERPLCIKRDIMVFHFDLLLFFFLQIFNAVWVKSGMIVDG